MEKKKSNKITKKTKSMSDLIQENTILKLAVATKEKDCLKLLKEQQPKPEDVTIEIIETDEVVLIKTSDNRLFSVEWNCVKNFHYLEELRPKD